MRAFLEMEKQVLANRVASKTILLAEADATNQLYLKTQLSLLNFNILTASNGVEALDLFKRNRVDIVLTNIYMPLLNGMETSKAIRAVAGARPPIIAISAGNFDIEILRRAAGINHFFHTPLNINELRKVLVQYQ